MMEVVNPVPAKPTLFFDKSKDDSENKENKENKENVVIKDLNKQYVEIFLQIVPKEFLVQDFTGSPA